MTEPHVCEHCRGTGHLEPDCPESRMDRRWVRTAGCVAVWLMAPFAIFGIMAGCAWGAAKAGFRFSARLWDVLWKRLRRDIDAG